MNGVIWKYEIPGVDYPELAMPQGALLLHFAEQRDTMTLWALVDPRRSHVTRRFRLAGTGHAVSLPDARHVGTVVLFERPLVFHLFDLGEEA